MEKKWEEISTDEKQETQFQKLLSLKDLGGNDLKFQSPAGKANYQAAYKALFEAGAEALKWAMAVGGVDGELATLGFPNVLGGFTKAPFDFTKEYGTYQ